MIPKTHKEILKRVLDQAKDKSFAEDSISFFWREVRKHLSDMTYHSIAVKGLGTYLIKHWKVEEYITIYDNVMRKKAYTYRMASKKKYAEINYNILRKIKEEYKIEENKKNAKKLEREKYEVDKHLEQQRKDSGGAA